MRAFRASVGVMLWPRGLTRGMALRTFLRFAVLLYVPPSLLSSVDPGKEAAGGYGTVRYSKSLPNSDEPERPY
jgi:hypothetical protein